MTTTYTSTSLSPELDAAFEAGVAWARRSAGEHTLLVGGEHRPGGAGVLVQRNPANHDEELGTFAAASADDVADAVAAARAAQPGWERTPVAERIDLLERVGTVLDRRIGEIGAAAALEVGKQRVESVGEVEEVVELFRVYAAQVADGLELPLEPASPHDLHRAVLRPFGVFGVIAPFNFPLALTAGPAAAALLAGNTVVAKPSPTTSWTAVLLGEAFEEAGLPPGAFNLVTGGDEAGRALVGSPDLDGIVFTGSYDVGMQIARSFAGAGRYPRPAITEMGGKNPAIVTASADLEAAAAGIARSAFGLSGQKCSACSRVLVDESVHGDLVDLLVEHAAAWTVADPVAPESRLGPVHTVGAYERFAAVVEEARASGTIAFGGRRPEDGLPRGWYAEPTVVTGLPAGHRLTREELFVPVLVVETTSSFEESLARANDQVYGLTAGLFTADEREIAAFLEGIEAGTVFVNRAAGATSGGWPGQQTYPGWKGSGSTGRGALGLRYVAQFLREQGHTVVGGGA